MTNQEFSDEFDIHYNNITSNQAPGLDEYEKSVFLTRALDEIVKAYFNPRLNKVQEGFDGNETRQIDFSMLIQTKVATEVTNVPRLYPVNNTKFFAVPNKILMFINEALMVTRDNASKYLTVIPLEYKEYNRLMSKPYKRPLKNLAWRVITNTHTTSTTTRTDYEVIANIIATSKDKNYTDVLTAIKNKTLTFVLVSLGGITTLSDTGTSQTQSSSTSAFNPSLVTVTYKFDDDILPGVTFTVTEKANLQKYINYNINSEEAVVEIIPGPTDIISTYTVRYVARPRAIILSTLDGVTIDGSLAALTCELDPILHLEILQRAVELAKAAWQGTLDSSVLIGSVSSTEKGVIPQSK